MSDIGLGKPPGARPSLGSQPSPGSQPWRRRAVFNQAGRAGPRRLLIIAVVGASTGALATALIFRGHQQPAVSFDARMKPVDALPGGLHSTPEQNALAFRADTTHAQAAATRGVSFTPPIAPSVPNVTADPRVEQAAQVVRIPPQPHFVGRPAPVYPPAPVIPPARPAVVTQSVGITPPPRAIRVADQRQTNDQQQPFDYSLFDQWSARPPRTVVVLPPSNTDANGADSDAAVLAPQTAGRRTNENVRPVSQTATETGHVLIPAGRGIYAHPVLALSSDQSSPAVFQADSGPIAGDRMIGSFSRQNNRLVIRISSVIHNGEQISTEGVVIAPETMEASVASGVDQHYLTRFILPAAAAFVEGLGQALATTSNTAAVLSPFGGVATSTNLNFHQQLGVAAGAAAADIGSTLNQAAPKGPTISLDANVSVGVIFLANVVEHDRR
ncbi:MAG: DotG/IcmE/VirB10 family protein [Acetobacteraceae bacterium]